MFPETSDIINHLLKLALYYLKRKQKTFIYF